MEANTNFPSKFYQDGKTEVNFGYHNSNLILLLPDNPKLYYLYIF